MKVCAVVGHAVMANPNFEITTLTDKLHVRVVEAQHKSAYQWNSDLYTLPRIPLRSPLLVLLNKLPLHDLHPTHLFLYLLQLVIQHELLLVQIIQRCLPALVVDLLPISLPAVQRSGGLPVLPKLVLMAAFIIAAFFLRQLLSRLAMFAIFLPFFIGFDPDAHLKGEIVILLPLAFQTVELRIDGLDCSQTGSRIRNVVLLHNSKQPRAVTQTVILTIRLYAGGKDVGRELEPQT